MTVLVSLVQSTVIVVHVLQPIGCFSWSTPASAMAWIFKRRVISISSRSLSLWPSNTDRSIASSLLNMPLSWNPAVMPHWENMYPPRQSCFPVPLVTDSYALVPTAWPIPACRVWLIKLITTTMLHRSVLRNFSHVGKLSFMWPVLPAAVDTGAQHLGTRLHAPPCWYDLCFPDGCITWARFCCQFLSRGCRVIFHGPLYHHSLIPECYRQFHLDFFWSGRSHLHSRKII